jgi:YggT family protein
MLNQIAIFLVDTLVTFLVFLLLARFLFQWLRVPFRNPAGEFILAATSWIVMPARRVIRPVVGLDAASLLLAWVLQAAGLWLQAAIAGGEPPLLAIVAVALVDLVRFAVYILVFALIMQAVLSWVNPHTPLSPVFDTFTRPFLRPLRRHVPPVGSVDLTPLIVLVILQVLLFPLGHLRLMAASLS